MPRRTTASLAVIGNIARVESVYSDGRRHDFVGGAALHIAHAATIFGQHAVPISVAGSDLDWIARHPNLAALDLSAVRFDTGHSCAFRLTYGADGEVEAVDVAYGVSVHLTDHALASIGRYPLHHVCCRRPLDPLRVLRALAEHRLAFSVDFFVSSAPEMIASVLSELRHARLVFCNTVEYRALSAVVAVEELEAVLITDGPRPARLLRHGLEVARVKPPTVEAIEATGAGDCLAGTFLAARSTGIPDQVALERAVTVASTRTLSPLLPIESSDR